MPLLEKIALDWALVKIISVCRWRLGRFFLGCILPFQGKKTTNTPAQETLPINQTNKKNENPEETGMVLFISVWHQLFKKIIDCVSEFQEYFQSLELCLKLINSVPAKTSTRPKLGIVFICWCSCNQRWIDHDDFIKTASASPGGFVGLPVIPRRNERIGSLPSYL